MHKLPALLAGILLTAITITLTACDVLGVGGTEPPPGTEPPTVEPSPTVAEAAPDPTDPPAAPQEPTPEPPTPAPAVSPWPLPADLYYLNDAGQVWRQSRLGDENAVAVITPLDVQVSDFSVAPGGEWIATRVNGSVSVSSLLDRRIGEVVARSAGTPPDTTQGHTMAWSPDGRKLAYTTDTGFQVYAPGEGAAFGPLVFDAQELPIVDMVWSPDSAWLLVKRGDNTQALYILEPTLSLWVELGPLNGFVWLPDARLVFAPSTGGLALLQPEDLGSRTFIVPEGRTASLPGATPDGSVLFFLHEGSLDAPGFLHTANPDDLSFSAEAAFPVMTPGWAWEPGAARLIRPAGEASPTMNLLDPRTGAPATFEAAGIPGDLAWGEMPPPRVAGAELPNDLYFLAPQAGIVQVWRLPADGSPPVAITNAPADVIDFDVAPQGTQIAFTSGGQLFRQVIGTLEAGVLVELDQGVTAAAPDWSPDGSRVAYQNTGIWIHDLNEGTDRRLIRDETPEQTGSERVVQLYGEPRWSPDGRWLLVRVSFFEGFDLAIMPVTEFGVVSVPSLLSVFGAQAEWLGTNQVVAYGQGGELNDPTVTLVTPAEEFNEPPTVTPLFDLPVLDASLRADERLALLRVPSPFQVGPTSVRLVTVGGDGAGLTAETEAFVVNSPALSSDATFVAGLANLRFDEFGQRSGEIEVIDLSSGQRLIIDGVTGVREIRWGP